MKTSKQSTAAELLIARRRRLSHAALWRRACPELETLPKRLRFRLCRWRSGAMPAATQDIEEFFASQAGIPGAAARTRLILERLEDCWDEHFGSIHLSLDDAFRAEQLADGAEDVVQLRAAADEAALMAWVEESEEHAARARVARAVVRRRIFRPGLAS